MRVIRNIKILHVLRTLLYFDYILFYILQSNQRVDVYEWRSGNDLTCISSLRGHTRVVSDTHFHRQDHNMIATCSIDTFTHIWDLRDVRKPVISLSGVGKRNRILNC